MEGGPCSKAVPTKQGDESAEGDEKALEAGEAPEKTPPHTPIPLQILWLLTNMSYTAAVFVTIVFYALMYLGTEPWLDYVVHMANSFYAVIDLWLSGTQYRLLHVVYPLAYMLVYIIFSIIYFAATGQSMYDILNWSDPGRTAGINIGLLLLVVVFHTLVWLMVQLRSFIQRRRHPTRWGDSCGKSARVSPAPSSGPASPTPNSQS